jgi:endoglucanase
LKALENVLPVCRKNNLKVRIGIVPWGRNQDFAWEVEAGNVDFSTHLYQFWDAFARKYKDERTIVIYEIMLEPNGKMMGAWQDKMLPECVRIIRKVNPWIWLGVMPGPWGMPTGFSSFKPIQDPYVVYCFHPYAPHSYLHQGVFKQDKETQDARAKGQEYPGMLKMFPGSPPSMWGREQLAGYVKPALDFSRKYNARMFADEFGVVRWAPGREKWTEDMISVLEGNGFDWCCFGLAGWNGWNPTFGPDDEGASDKPYGGKETPVLKVWKKYWALNKTGNPSR